MSPKSKGTVDTSRLERLEVEYAAIDSIRPNRYNPNRQSEADYKLLLRSMTEDGFTQPVIVQRETREIVDGEHRWRAGKELGYTEIPIVLVSMDEAQMRLSTLRHNRARGSEDMDLSAQLFRDFRELGSLEAVQDALNLPPGEIERILDDTPAPEALAGKEFTNAWEPMGHNYPTTEHAIRNIANRGPTLESTSPDAIAIIQRQEAMAISAPNENERVEALNVRNRTVFRFAYSYSFEEGAIISAVLGDRPAARLVELCRARVAAASG